LGLEIVGRLAKYLPVLRARREISVRHVGANRRLSPRYAASGMMLKACLNESV
jgi:hypothetical protein